MKFDFIKQHLLSYPIRLVCLVLEVSRWGYYAWLKRPASAQATRRVELAGKIREVHEHNRKVYGSPRVHRALLAQGESVCENTVAAVMKAQQIQARTKRKYVPCTADGNHACAVAANVLDRQFTADLPNQPFDYAQNGRWISRTSPPMKDGCTSPA